MKSVFVALSVILAGAFAKASTPDSADCFSAVEQEASRIFRGSRVEQSMDPLKYKGSKVLVYGARLVLNGGRMEIEATVEKDTCQVLNIFTVWAD